MTPAFMKNNSHFDTGTDTVTDLVNVKHEGNIPSALLLLVRCTQSIALTMQGGSAITGNIFMRFMCLLTKPHTAFPQIVQNHKLCELGK